MPIFPAISEKKKTTKASSKGEGKAGVGWVGNAKLDLVKDNFALNSSVCECRNGTQLAYLWPEKFLGSMTLLLSRKCVPFRLPRANAFTAMLSFEAKSIVIVFTDVGKRLAV